MSRKNTIGIVGYISSPPELVLDAPDWTQRVYETTLIRMRPSRTEDTYVLRFDGSASGSEEMLGRITEGAPVLVGGEIRSENVHDPKPEENRVRIYIFAEMIAVNDPPADDQNEAKICGYVCKPPHLRTIRSKAAEEKKTVASIIVAVNAETNTSYIPCVCFGQQALRANALSIGDYVEIYGRFQSRNFKKRIKGRTIPYLATTHELSVIRFKSSSFQKKQKEQEKEGEVGI